MTITPLQDPLRLAIADTRSLATPYPVSPGEERMLTELFLQVVVANLTTDVLRGQVLEDERVRVEIEGAVNMLKFSQESLSEPLAARLDPLFPPPPPLPTYTLEHLNNPAFICEGPFHLDASESDLSDEELASLVVRYPNIERLTLDYCQQITDAGLSTSQTTYRSKIFRSWLLPQYHPDCDRCSFYRLSRIEN